MHVDAIRWAEGLIRQLPDTHDGRNTWLLNCGTSAEATEIRNRWETKTGQVLPVDVKALDVVNSTV